MDIWVAVNRAPSVGDQEALLSLVLLEKRVDTPGQGRQAWPSATST